MKCKCTQSRAARFARDRVSIKKQNGTRADSGQVIEVPIAIANGSGVRCAVIDIRGREYQRGVSMEAGVDFVVETRFRRDVEPTYELEVTAGKHLGKTLDVVAVIHHPETGRPRETHMHCKYKAA